MDKRLLITREQIQKRVTELAARISADYEGKDLLMIGILKGAVLFMADLIREISVPHEIDFIRAASYGAHTYSSGEITLTKDCESPINGKSVVLVEDIVDTGLTLHYLVDLLKQRDPESVGICALIDKPERRHTEIDVDYCGFTIEKGFLVGFGLDYNEKYRYLPDVYLLEDAHP